jgi:hypothetical protein
MTALHIRKNLAFLLRSTAQAVENIEPKKIKPPSINEMRLKVALAIMPPTLP